MYPFFDSQVSPTCCVLLSQDRMPTHEHLIATVSSPFKPSPDLSQCENQPLCVLNAEKCYLYLRNVSLQRKMLQHKGIQVSRHLHDDVTQRPSEAPSPTLPSATRTSQSHTTAPWQSMPNHRLHFHIYRPTLRLVCFLPKNPPPEQYHLACLPASVPQVPLPCQLSATPSFATRPNPYRVSPQDHPLIMTNRSISFATRRYLQCDQAS